MRNEDSELSMRFARRSSRPVRRKIASMNLCLGATIDDYPIGRRERGKCRLHVERAAGKGYRAVRTTTNKFGRWCAPKKSTYRNSVYVVIRDYDDEHQVVWLAVGNPAAQWGGAHCTVQYANGEGFSLAKCWRNDAPHPHDDLDQVEAEHHRGRRRDRRANPGEGDAHARG